MVAEKVIFYQTCFDVGVSCYMVVISGFSGP